ncbi:DUF3592 domain-containing protein [Streptomyces sp. NPDC047002]|uniref:DUF3592 domain-containing protein n=1 Tax=Streptomyces sp. NPDC047002 TaxID=3155475 RepID=UPI00345592B6
MWAVLLLLLGVAGIGSGIYEAVVHRRLRREGVRVQGVVVRHRRSGSAKDGVSYTAVVGFFDAQGSRHEFEAGLSGVKGLPVGGAAPVLYLPGAPKTARVDLAGKRIGNVAFPMAIGGVFTAAAVFLLATGR